MRLRKPFDGDFRITQRYWREMSGPDNPWHRANGERYNPYAPLAGHNGVDWAVPGGTVLRAPFAGTVQRFNDFPRGINSQAGYGINVEISGSGEWSDYYCILAHGAHNGFLAPAGSFVEEGQPVLLSDNTGFSTANHLHFGLRVKNSTKWSDAMRGWIDPLPFITQEVIPLPPWTLMTADERKDAMEAMLQRMMDAVLPVKGSLPEANRNLVEAVRVDLETYRGNL